MPYLLLIILTWEVKEVSRRGKRRIRARRRRDGREDCGDFVSLPEVTSNYYYKVPIRDCLKRMSFTVQVDFGV